MVSCFGLIPRSSGNIRLRYLSCNILDWYVSLSHGGFAAAEQRDEADTRWRACSLSQALARGGTVEEYANLFTVGADDGRRRRRTGRRWRKVLVPRRAAAMSACALSRPVSVAASAASPASAASGGRGAAGARGTFGTSHRRASGPMRAIVGPPVVHLRVSPGRRPRPDVSCLRERCRG